MSTLSKKLFISILTLVLTVGAFTATTFAWLTLGNEATTGNISGTMESAGGLEISLDGQNWRTHINDAELAQKLFEGSSDFRFQALTSIDGKVISSYGNLEKAYSLTNYTDLVDDTYFENGFIYLPIHFRSANGGTVKLAQMNLISEQKSMLADVDFTNITVTADVAVVTKAEVDISANLLDAIRISFTNEDDSTVVFEPHNIPQGTNAALESNTLTNGNAAVENKSFKPTFAGAHAYYIAKGRTLLGYSTSTPLVDEDNKPLVLSTLVQNELDKVSLPATVAVSQATVNQTLLTLEEANVPQKVYLRIWVEGWDAQAYNILFATQLTTNFKFTIA